MKLDSKDNLIQLIRLMATHYPDAKLIVSSHPNGCQNGQSKVYIKLWKGRSGGAVIPKDSPCMPNSEVEKYKKTLRELIVQTLV